VKVIVFVTFNTLMTDKSCIQCTIQRSIN